METLTLLYLAAVVLACVLTCVDTRWRVLPLIALLAVMYAAFASLLSRPKPAHVEMIDAEAQLLAYELRQDEAIFVWVLLPDAYEPRAYTLPWSEDKARKTHEAARRAAAEGGQLKIRLRPNGEWVVHDSPPDPLPPKQE